MLLKACTCSLSVQPWFFSVGFFWDRRAKLYTVEDFSLQKLITDLDMRNGHKGGV